jgi:hypothetical protein
MRRFLKQFSFPGRIGSHVIPETPDSVHEGGELCYSISHALTRISHSELEALIWAMDGLPTFSKQGLLNPCIRQWRALSSTLLGRFVTTGD